MQHSKIKQNKTIHVLKQETNTTLKYNLIKDEKEHHWYKETNPDKHTAKQPSYLCPQTEPPAMCGGAGWGQQPCNRETAAGLRIGGTPCRAMRQ